MNAKIEDTEVDLTETLTDWRPPGWIVGDPDEPYVPERIESLYAMYAKNGYYTRGGTLTEKALNLSASDREEVEAVIHNRKLLRDAWNTHEVAWRLGAALTGRPFKVDPFWNQGTQGLPRLSVRLDGLTPLTDGMLTVDEARTMLTLNATQDDVRAGIEARLESLGDVPDDFPLNWRGDLKRGKAAAAANGPHSCTAKWLRCVAAYGTEEFAAAFVPDNGDGWFQSIAMTATLVVRLGRVPCSPPPGVKSSSPRGASALCVWVPPKVRERVVALDAQLQAAENARDRDVAQKALDRQLPEPTRRVMLGGHSIAVPMWKRPRAGTQYAIVQRGDLLDGDDSIVDFGLA